MNRINESHSFAPVSPSQLNQWSDELTLREKDCAFFLARGFSAKEIGRQLDISARTVESHIQRIKIKLNCYSRQQLIKKIWHI